MKTIRRIEWPALLLLLLAAYQVIFGLGEYPSLWLKRAWKSRGLSGMERSALFFLGGTGSQFMGFIAANVPQDQAVVVPERSAAFSSQSSLAYYLAPRKIIACGCDSYGNKCFSCLDKADHAIPVTRNFPPEDWHPGEKQYIPFNTAESDYYLGLYVSPGWQIQAESTTNEVPLVLAALLDVFVWAAWLVLGIFMVRWINPGSDWGETLALAIFLGMGLHTWVIFIFSWAGIPITTSSVVISGLVLINVGWLGIRKQPGHHFSAIKRQVQESFHRGWQTSFPSKALGMAIVAMFAVIAAIAIARSYSTYDDIAIWSLKGHAIAQEGTIFAARESSGHGLAYPLNLSLLITVFQLIDGDTLPGSKLIFPLSLAVIAFTFYRFWRKWCVQRNTALAAVLLLFSIPVIFLHATLGFANLTFTGYLLLGILWGLRGLENCNRHDLRLSGLLFALAGWTRPEGVLFAALLMLVLAIFHLFSSKQKTFALLGHWAVPMIIPIIWLIFAAHDIRQDQAGSALQETAAQLIGNRFNFEAIKATLAFAGQQALDVPSWGVVLPFALVTIVLFTLPLWKNSPALSKNLAKLILMTALCALIPLGLFAIEATNESDFHTFLTVSFDRAFFPAAFLLVFWAVLTMGANVFGVQERLEVTSQ